MALIKTKVPGFNGYRASVMFRNGVGRTNDTRLSEWFETHGYIVETTAEEDKAKAIRDLEKKSADELKSACKSHGINVANTKDKDKLIEKLKEVM